MSDQSSIPNSSIMSGEDRRSLLELRRKKVKLQSKYSKINSEINRLKDGPISLKDIPKHCVFLKNSLKTSDDLLKDVFDMDSNKYIEYDTEYILNASQVNQIVVKSLQIDEFIFQPAIFADKLLRHIRDSQSDGNFYISEDNEETDSRAMLVGIANLGRKAEKLFKSAPILDFFYGAFDPGQVNIPAKKRRNNVSKLEIPTETKTPNTSEGVTENDDLKNGKEVERLFHKILGLSNENSSKSVPFSRITIDPKSFGRTVENIFYSAFLVKEGVVALEEDGESVVVRPVDETEAESFSEKDQPSTHQSILTFSMDDWKKWTKVAS